MNDGKVERTSSWTQATHMKTLKRGFIPRWTLQVDFYFPQAILC
jgi:hypothetical protein